MAQVNEIVSPLGIALITEADVNSQREKLQSVQRWLARQGLTDEQRKDVIAKIKDAIFDNLAPTDIEKSYWTLVNALAARLKRRHS